MENDKNRNYGQEDHNPQERKFDSMPEENKTGNTNDSENRQQFENNQNSDAETNRDLRSDNENQDTDNPIVNPIDFEETIHNDADGTAFLTPNPDGFRDYEDSAERTDQNSFTEDGAERIGYKDTEDSTDRSYQNLNPDDRYSEDIKDTEESKNLNQNTTDYVDFEDPNSKTLNSEVRDAEDYTNPDRTNLSPADADEISDDDYIDPTNERNDSQRTQGL